MINHYRHQHQGPAFGPRPRLALSEDEVFDLIWRIPGYVNQDWSHSKNAAWNRYLILTEQYRTLIQDKINACHHNKTVKEDLVKHIDLSTNLALDIAREICVVWKHGAKRFVPDATDAQNEALRQLVQEAQFDSHARQWNREAFFLGPVTVIPVMRGGKMHFDTLLPHFYDVIDNPDDLWGAPIAAGWEVLDRDTLSARHGHHGATPDAGAATSIVLDGSAWEYYRVRGKGDQASVERIGREPHGMGEFPGATLSFERSHGEGRWDCNHHQRLVDATITISYLDAVLGLVRKGQNQKLLALKGDLESIPKQQIRHPESSIVANVDDIARVDIEAIDFDTDPENAIKHQAWKMQGIARSYGGQVASRPGGTSHLESEITFSHQALTEQRNEQMPFALAFERELLAKAVRVAKQQRHPLADDLPDSDLVRTSLLTQYPPLSRQYADVRSEIEHNDWQISKGVKSLSDLVRQQMPNASDEQLQEHIAANLDKDAPLIAKMTTRDTSMAPGSAPAAESQAQVDGASGPAARDGTAVKPKSPTED